MLATAVAFVLGIVSKIGARPEALVAEGGERGTEVSVDEGKVTPVKPDEPFQWPSDAPPPAIAPFGPEQARQHQQAWANHLDVPFEMTNSIGVTMVLIPPGEFMMGSSEEEIASWLAEDKGGWKQQTTRA